MPRFSTMIQVIDSHTAGEPTRIVTSGVPSIPGKTMREKWEYAQHHLDSLRRVLMMEPRGHNDMFGALVINPCRPDADVGLLFCDTGGWLTMCGHGTIGVASALIELGMMGVELEEPNVRLDTPSGFVPARVEQTGREGEVAITLRFDTPAGLVCARVEVQGGEITGVWVDNVPSFLYRERAGVKVKGLGEIHGDIAFGGNFFFVVPVEQLGIPLELPYAGKLVELGMDILSAARQQLPVQHPIETHIQSIELVEFTQPGTNGADFRNMVVFGQGNFDRSPCGTGTCARMAELHAQGKLPLGKVFIHESIIGTRFEGVLLGETSIGTWPAVLPRFRGQAYITGFNTLVVDPRDPLQAGFVIRGIGPA